MYALFKNILDDEDVTLSATSVTANNPLSNLLDDMLVKYARIGDGSQYIQVSCGASKTIDAMAIAGWGFSSVVFQASNTVDFSTLIANQTVTNLSVQPDTKCGFLNSWLSAPITAKYFRIVFSGENKKSVGKISVGIMEKFPWMESKQKIGKISTVKRSRSQGGHLYAGNTGYNARFVEISFPEYNDDGFKLFDLLWQTCKNTRAFFCIVWTQKQDILPILYGSIDQDGIDQDATGIVSFPFTTKIRVMERF